MYNKKAKKIESHKIQYIYEAKQLLIQYHGKKAHISYESYI